MITSVEFEPIPPNGNIILPNGEIESNPINKYEQSFEREIDCSHRPEFDGTVETVTMHDPIEPINKPIKIKVDPFLNTNEKTDFMAVMQKKNCFIFSITWNNIINWLQRMIVVPGLTIKTTRLWNWTELLRNKNQK